MKTPSTLPFKKVFVFGLGRMGNRHLKALQSFPKISISGYDPAYQSSALLPKSFCIYKNPLQGIQKAKPDLVIISSTGPSHFENFKLALRSPKLKAILCEKPLTTSVKKAEEMFRLAKKTKSLKFTIHYWRRYHPWYQLLQKKISQENFLGKMTTMSVTCGAGGLGCVGIHFFDFARWIFQSEPQSVTAFLRTNSLPVTRGNKFEDPGLYGIVNFKQGQRLFFDFSEDFGLPSFLEICGTHGRVIIDENTGSHSIFSRSQKFRSKSLRYYSEPIQKHPFSKRFSIDLVQTARWTILSLLHQSKSSHSCFQNGIQALAMYTAARLSAKNHGQCITFPLSSKSKKLDFQIT